MRVEFFDVGAVVYFLRKVIWTVPDFDVDRYRDRLRALHDRIQADGVVRLHRAALPHRAGQARRAGLTRRVWRTTVAERPDRAEPDQGARARTASRRRATSASDV